MANHTREAVDGDGVGDTRPGRRRGDSSTAGWRTADAGGAR